MRPSPPEDEPLGLYMLPLRAAEAYTWKGVASTPVARFARVRGRVFLLSCTSALRIPKNFAIRNSHLAWEKQPYGGWTSDPSASILGVLYQMTAGADHLNLSRPTQEERLV